MFESKSLFGDYREMRYFWARIYKIRTFSNLRRALSKRLTLSAVLIFVTESLFIYIYFISCHFKEIIEIRFPELEKQICNDFAPFS